MCETAAPSAGIGLTHYLRSISFMRVSSSWSFKQIFTLFFWVFPFYIWIFCSGEHTCRDGHQLKPWIKTPLNLGEGSSNFGSRSQCCTKATGVHTGNAVILIEVSLARRPDHTSLMSSQPLSNSSIDLLYHICERASSTCCRSFCDECFFPHTANVCNQSADRVPLGSFYPCSFSFWHMCFFSRSSPMGAFPVIRKVMMD